MEVIHSRSPYYVTTPASDLVRATLEVYIYDGEQNIDRQDATYTLTSTPVDSSGFVSWNISDIVYSEINKNFQNIRYIWVDYRIIRQGRVGVSTSDFTNAYATLGYGYYEDNYNPNFSKTIPLSVDSVYKSDDGLISVPVDTSKSGIVSFQGAGSSVERQVFTATNFSEDLITYFSPYGEDDFKQRVIDDGGSFVGGACLNSFYDTYKLTPLNKVIVTYDDGEIGVLDVVDVCESRYTPYKIWFINKYGVKEEFWFFKMSKLSLNTKKDEYRLNSLNDYLNGDLSRHSKVSFNLTGSETLTMNSGWVDEKYNETFRQMMLSEYLWIDYEDNILPINMKSKDLDYKTSLNDKLINYQIEVEFSFNKINNIR